MTDSLAILSSNGNDSTDTPAIPKALPILPLKNIVVFPGTVTPLRFNRPESLAALKESIESHRFVALAWQEDPELETVKPENLPKVATLARLVRAIQHGSEGVTVIVQGQDRVQLGDYVHTEPFLKAEADVLLNHLPKDDTDYWEAAVRNLQETANRLVELDSEIPDDAKHIIQQIDEPILLTDVLAANLGMPVADKQRLLEQANVQRRVEIVQRFLNDQLHIAELQAKLKEDMKTEFSDSQKRAFLREQVRTIRKELGEDDGGQEQLDDLTRRIDAAELPKVAREAADRELKRLALVPPASPEHSVMVTYLETLAELPWNKLSETTIDLNRARGVLDRDHFGLEKVKRRLVEYLAVRKLNPLGRSPILCLSGPPGVGKTSLGRSVAEALGREFVRISVGGLRDESEIRGHRRTYIGSMPGRIIQELRRAGTRNPVILLDEVDKIGADFRGDPASALLEVLDPNQNHDFVDRYLDVPFDLSQVIFIATANYLDPIPAPLLDRMEVLELPGYTEREKHAIARQYLVKKQLGEHGLDETLCPWEDAAIDTIVEYYTREAGVRNLERQIGSVCRRLAAAYVDESFASRPVTPALVKDTLGPYRFVREDKRESSEPGVVNGLAYTPVGGEVLHIEAIAYPGTGQVKLTGQLGDVMKESVQAAYSLVKNRANLLGIAPETLKEQDIHVHVPAGAIPKDGPSAGIAMFTALASLLAGKRVRHDVAMTGEVTLRGLVLPIGGLKEKTIAALRAGVKTVLIPKQNEKDLPELPDEVRKRLTIIPVATVNEVLAQALENFRPRRHD